MTPMKWPIWTLGGMVGRVYVGEHYALLHTRCMSLVPHGFREDIFKFFSWWELKFFPIISLWKFDPWGGASLDPRNLIGRIYVKDH